MVTINASLRTAELLAAFHPTIIKGNAAEIAALSENSEVASRGVDAVGSGFADPGGVVKALARKRRESSVDKSHGRRQCAQGPYSEVI